MNSSRSLPTDVSFRTIRFPDNSVLTSASSLLSNVHCRKRLRVDGEASFFSDVKFAKNVTVGGTISYNGAVDFTGPIPYVDDQTGWGLPQWTYADPSDYNKTTDSLIIKITNLNSLLTSTYATKTYVDSKTTLNAGLVYASPGTYPVYDGTGFYTKGVTHPASDTFFVIRDGVDHPVNFQFQKGDVQTGKFLRCSDGDGTVQWADADEVVFPTITGIDTSNGPSTSSTFFVTDDVGTTRGMFFYPNIDTASGFNSSMQPYDIALLAGQGNTQNGSTQWKFFMGPYNGFQGIRMTSDYTVNSITQRGNLEFYAGGANQKITVDASGIKLIPLSNQTTSLLLSNVITDLSAAPPIFRKPFYVTVPNYTGNDQYPIAFFSKSGTENSVAVNQGISIFSKLNSFNWNPLIKPNANAIISADYGNLMNDGQTSVYNEKDIQFFVGPWSPYTDGFTVRPNIQAEINSTVAGGYTQMTSYNSQNYIQVNKNGIVQLTGSLRTIDNYGIFRVLNKTGAIYNNSNTDVINSQLQIGTTTSNVNMNLSGLLKYFYSGAPVDITNYILASSNNAGDVQYKPFIDLMPSNITKSLTFKNHVTFEEKITYTKNLPTIDTDFIYCLGNDGTNGDVKWVKIPLNTTTEKVTVDKSIDFTDAVTLYNQMFFIDAGLITAGIVGGVAYAVASSINKGSQSWTSPDSLLNFIWRFEDNTVGNPPYTYSCKMNKTGMNGKFLRVADSYAPASDYIVNGNISPTDLQFYLSNLTVTDAFQVTLNSVLYNVPVTNPGQFCLPGYFNYRAPGIGNYDVPSAGDMLINWGGNETYVPPTSLSSQEYYGRARWKKLSDILPRSVTWDQYYENNVFIGSEFAYSVNDYGVLKQVATNVANLSVFGKMFYRYALSDISSGSSPFGYFLTCLDGTTGEVGWAQATATLPSTASFTSLTTSTLSVSDTATIGSTLTISGTGTALTLSSGSISSKSITTSDTSSLKGITLTGSINGSEQSCNIGALTANYLSSFQNGVTVNNDFTANNMIYILSNKGLGKVLACTDGTTGRAEWVDPGQAAVPTDILCNSVTANKLTAISVFDTFTTTASPFPTNNWEILFLNDTLPTFNQLYTTASVTGVSFTVPANCSRGFIYRTNLWVDFFWAYAKNRTSTSEAMNIYFRVFNIAARIYRNNSIVETRVIYPQQTKNYPAAGYGIRISHDRYVNGSIYDTNLGTYFNNKIFLYSPEIWFNVQQSSETATYRIDFNVSWSYQLQGINTGSGTAGYLIRNASTQSWFRFYTYRQESPENQDPIKYNTQAWDGSINYGFQATVHPTGSDVNTASVGQFIANYWNVEVNGSTTTGVRNSYVWLGSDSCFHKNFVSTSAFLPTNNNATLSVANANIRDLTCQNILLPNGGIVYSSGFACRKGFPLDPPNGVDPDLMIQSTYDFTNGGNNDIQGVNYRGSYDAWGNTFNIWWQVVSPSPNNIQFWIDSTFINQLPLTTSDRRIKENFTEAPSVLDRLCQLPMYQFDFIKYEVIHPSHRHVGFIADEMQELFPDIPHLISDEKNKVDANGKYVLQHRNDNEIISVLIKAIQELREEVVQLKNQLGLL